MKKTFTTKEQGVVSLSMEEMQVISKTYEVECTKEYLYENYPDWSDEKVSWVAFEAREIMQDADSSEEVEAVAEAVEKYTKEYVMRLAVELVEFSQEYDYCECYKFSDMFESEAVAIKHACEMLTTEEGIENFLEFCADILSEKNEQEEIKPKAKELQEKLLGLKKGV